MALSRMQVSNRRTALVTGLGMSALLFVLFPALVQPLEREEQPRSILFGDISDWPHFVREGWLPLDFLVAFASAYLLMRMTLALNERDKKDQSGVKYWAKFLCGVFIGFGGLGGLLGSILEGWFSGIEYFFGAGVMVMLVLAFFGVGGACVLGLCLVIGKVGGALLKTRPLKPIVNGFRHAGNYLEAKDVPAPEEDVSEPA